MSHKQFIIDKELDQWIKVFTNNLIKTWKFSPYRADEIRDTFFVALRAYFEFGSSPEFIAEQFGCNMRRNLNEEKE